MLSRKSKDGYLLRLDKGELLISELKGFCEQENIKSGVVQGIGGALWAEIAFYHLERKAYEYDRLEETLEIVSLSGNISLVNDKPHLHLHVVLSDADYHAYGGHLKELAVGGTCEISIRTINEPISRVHSEEIGLKLWDL